MNIARENGNAGNHHKNLFNKKNISLLLLKNYVIQKKILKMVWDVIELVRNLVTILFITQNKV